MFGESTRRLAQLLRVFLRSRTLAFRAWRYLSMRAGCLPAKPPGARGFMEHRATPKPDIQQFNKDPGPAS